MGCLLSFLAEAEAWPIPPVFGAFLKITCWEKSVNCFYTCFIFWMISMFSSTSDSCELRTPTTKPVFQFSMSVFLLVAFISYYCIAKLPTCYFLRVSTSILMPDSQSSDSTRVTNSLSISFSNSSCYFLVFRTVPILLKGYILAYTLCFCNSSSGLRTISVYRSMSWIDLSWSRWALLTIAEKVRSIF